MIYEGKVQKGLGNANYWIKKVEKIFYEKTNMKLFYGTLNIMLEKPYKLQKYFIIKKEEYGGTQDVLVQECKIFGEKAYILRAEKTAHKDNILEIVSNINFRKTYNLKDDDEIQILVIN